jgi:hypothetical protein
VRLKRPIVIEVTQSMVGPGLDLNGARLIADFNDATKRAITGTVTMWTCGGRSDLDLCGQIDVKVS